MRDIDIHYLRLADFALKNNLEPVSLKTRRGTKMAFIKTTNNEKNKDFL
jgi:hypothetical protein